MFPPLFALWLMIMVLQHSLLYSFEQAVHAWVLLNSVWEKENMCHSCALLYSQLCIWSISGISCMEIYGDSSMMETTNHLKILSEFLGAIYCIKWQNKFSLQLSFFIIFQSFWIYNNFVIYPWVILPQTSFPTNIL